MTHAMRWRGQGRIFLQAGSFAFCCLLAIRVHAFVASDALSDLVSAALPVLTLVIFLAALGFALASALQARTQPERVVLRAVPIGLLLLAAIFVKESYADVSIALYALTESSDNTKTAVVLGPRGDDVRISGDLTEGAAEALSSLLASHPGVDRVHLTSEGGLADEGEALRKVIAAHKLSTYVPDYCVSACTLAFVGGRDRYVTEEARLGFHSPFSEGLFNQTFAGDSTAERAAYLAAGLAPDFVDEALKIKPDDIWTPEKDRLIAAGVVTQVVDNYRFPDSNLDGSATQATARAAVLRNFPLVKALDGSRPKAVDVIAALYLDAYRRGVSEGKIVDDLTAIVGGAASVAMAHADDETLVGFGHFIDAAMEAADSDEACVAIGAKASLIEAEAALNEVDDQAGADKSAIELLTRALATRQPSAAASRDPTHSSIGTGEIAPSGTRRLPCDRMRSIYAHALKLPRRDAAALIRTLVERHPRDVPLASALVGGIVH